MREKTAVSSSFFIPIAKIQAVYITDGAGHEINIEFGKKSWYSCELPLEAANAVFDKIVSKTEGFYRPSKTNDYDGLSTTLLFPNKIIKAVLRERQDKQIKYSFETGV